jgi:hypothetical protein
MTDATPGATIHYTTDGSTPSQTHGKIYKTPFNLTESATVQAIAVKSKQANSEVTLQAYTVTH